MTQLYARELQTALAAVAGASRICRMIQQTLAPEALAKKDKSPVTVADFSSQAIVCRELESRFPDDPVIAEEDSRALQHSDNLPYQQQIMQFMTRSGIDSDFPDICRWIDRGNALTFSPRFWTLDPVDGTKGFLRSEQYAVALALIVEGQPLLSALGCPNLVDPETGNIGQILYAVRGQGAFTLPLDAMERNPRPIHVSTQQQIEQARMCESVEAGHSAHDVSAQVTGDLGISGTPVRLDSQAKYAVVAQGLAEIYLRLPTRADYREKIWDHAAGALIVREAGGTVTDVTGKPLQWTHGSELSENRGIVVSHGPWHQQIIDRLKHFGVK